MGKAVCTLYRGEGILCTLYMGEDYNIHCTGVRLYYDGILYMGEDVRYTLYRGETVLCTLYRGEASTH